WLSGVPSEILISGKSPPGPMVTLLLAKVAPPCFIVTVSPVGSPTWAKVERLTKDKAAARMRLNCLASIGKNLFAFALRGNHRAGRRETGRISSLPLDIRQLYVGMERVAAFRPDFHKKPSHKQLWHITLGLCPFSHSVRVLSHSVMGYN